MYLESLEKNTCYGCFACYNICPTDSIKMIEDQEGFLYPNIDEKSCINCGKCFDVCPYNLDITSSSTIFKKRVYAARSKNRQNLNSSSSGGIFSELAKVILEKGGLVYGVGFDKNFKAIHKSIDNLNNLDDLKGSKYIQSEINYIFCDIRDNLDAGKNILFCGTPCQVKGLKNFLDKDYTKLYTIDFVCHGVPSYKIFRKYLNWIEREYNSKVVSIDFRNKDNGWTLYNQKIIFDNGESYKSTKLDNPFMLGFRNNAYLRPSCHTCEFATKERFSEITLGDFWGLNVFHPLFYKDVGASLVMINSSKGDELFYSIKESIEFEKSTIQKALKSNGCLVNPSKQHKKRNEIISKILDSDNFRNAIFSFFNYKKSIILKNKLKIVIKKWISNYKRFINIISNKRG